MYQVSDDLLIQVAEGKNVIKSHEYTALFEANQIIEQAKQVAAQIHQDAQAEYEAQRIQGYEDGKDAVIKRYAEDLQSYQIDVNNRLDQLEGTLAEVAMSINRRILGEKPPQDVLYGLVTQALKDYRKKVEIKVLVNPAMVELVEARLKDYVERHPFVVYVSIGSDASLSTTACIVDSGSDFIPVNLEEQLAIIEEKLKQIPS